MLVAHRQTRVRADVQTLVMKNSVITAGLESLQNGWMLVTDVQTLVVMPVFVCDVVVILVVEIQVGTSSLLTVTYVKTKVLQQVVKLW